jgi:hypothetical protein
MVRTAIFDVDGTLVDSVEGLAAGAAGLWPGAGWVGDVHCNRPIRLSSVSVDNSGGNMASAPRQPRISGASNGLPRKEAEESKPLNSRARSSTVSNPKGLACRRNCQAHLSLCNNRGWRCNYCMAICSRRVRRLARLGYQLRGCAGNPGSAKQTDARLSR